MKGRMKPRLLLPCAALALALSPSILRAQSGVGGISAKAFPVQVIVSALPTANGTQGLRIVTNAASTASCTVGGGSVKLLCIDNGAWTPLTGGGGSSADDQTAAEVPITDSGAFYTGADVEAALAQIGADTRWTNARTPTAHNHTTAEVTSGVFSDARVSSSSVTQHESDLEGVLDLSELQGTLTINQVPIAATANALSANPIACSIGDFVTDIAADGTLTCDTPTSGGVSDHGALIGLSDDDHTQYPLSPGRSGGQTLIGGTSSGESLSLRPNSSADRNNGFVCFGKNGVSTTGFPCVNPRENNGEGMFEITDGSGGGYGMIRVTAWYTGTADSKMHRDSGLSLRGSFPISWYSGDLNSSVDTTLSREAPAVVKIGDSVRMVPRSTPPVTCGAANTMGVEYTDDSGAKCWCSGSVWVVVAGAGTCT